MDLVALFNLADDDHLAHRGMTVEVELRALDGNLLLRCSCGARVEVPQEMEELHAPRP